MVRVDASRLPPRYRGAEWIARGGMGEIYRAEDGDLDRVVAIKVLADRFAGDDAIRERFTREALTAARLSSAPGTVTIFDVGEHEGRPYIVMEYLGGGSLADRIAAEGAQPLGRSLAWLRRGGGRARRGARERDRAPRRQARQPAPRRRRPGPRGRLRRRERRAPGLADGDGHRRRHSRLPGARAGPGRARERPRATATRWRSSPSSSSPARAPSRASPRPPRRWRTRALRSPRRRGSIPSCRPASTRRSLEAWRRIPSSGTTRRPSSYTASARRSTRRQGTTRIVAAPQTRSSGASRSRCGMLGASSSRRASWLRRCSRATEA